MTHRRMIAAVALTSGGSARAKRQTPTNGPGRLERSAKPGYDRLFRWAAALAA